MPHQGTHGVVPQQAAQQCQSKTAVIGARADASGSPAEPPSALSPPRAGEAGKMTAATCMDSASGDKIHADGSASAAAATAAAATQMRNVADAYAMALAALAPANPQEAAQRAAAAAAYRDRFRDDTADAATLGSAAAVRYSMDTSYMRPSAAAAAAASRFSLDTRKTPKPAAADIYSSLLYGIPEPADSTELPPAAAQPAAQPATPVQRSAFATPAAQQAPNSDYMAACGDGRLIIDHSATLNTLDDILEDPTPLQASAPADSWHNTCRYDAAASAGFIAGCPSLLVCSGGLLGQPRLLVPVRSGLDSRR